MRAVTFLPFDRAIKAVRVQEQERKKQKPRGEIRNELQLSSVIVKCLKKRRDKLQKILCKYSLVHLKLHIYNIAYTQGQGEQGQFAVFLLFFSSLLFCFPQGFELYLNEKIKISKLETALCQVTETMSKVCTITNTKKISILFPTRDSVTRATYSKKNTMTHVFATKKITTNHNL